MSKLLAWPFLLLQVLLPQHALTAAVYQLARIQYQPIKDFLIRRFAALYNIDVEEADRPVPDGYSSLNDFFTRSLVENARPVDTAESSLVSPVDGTVSAAGAIEKNQVFQAKGINYSLADLLMSDVQDADQFVDGQFATLYLAPYNYHRVHSPLDATLRTVRYVPGALYSVNEATVSTMPGLFTRNERLICHFESEKAPFILIFVGALHVGSISTPWTGEIRPRRKGVVQEIDIPDNGVPVNVKKGDDIGCFNMGSTVILLLPPESFEFDASLIAGVETRTGAAIGHIRQNVHV